MRPVRERWSPATGGRCIARWAMLPYFLYASSNRKCAMNLTT
jgi:hypothetical protein